MSTTRHNHYPRAQASNQVHQTNIPSSTVAAIGGGFLCFGLTVILCLTAFRLFKVHKEVNRRRRRGENITFRREWRRIGGFWGFMIGMNENQSMGIGAGASSLERSWAIQNWLLREKEQMVVKKRPEMWEVAIPKQGDEGTDEVDWRHAEPMSTYVSDRKNGGDGTNPIVDVSVIVILPFDKEVPTEEDDLPDMAIGTTNLLPIRYSRPTTTRSVNSDDLIAKDKGAVVQVEDVEGEPYPAKWIKKDGRWMVEGLE